MSFWPLQVFQQKFAKSLLTLRTKIKEKQNKQVVIVIVAVVVVIVVVAVVVSTAEWFLPEYFWDIFIIIATFRASLFGESTSGGRTLDIVDLNKTRSRLQKGDTCCRTCTRLVSGLYRTVNFHYAMIYSWA